MNHIRRPMDERIRKKMNKEIKSGEKQFLTAQTTPSRSDTLTVKEELKKLPLKSRKSEKSLLDSLKKNLLIKKKKRRAPQSKRTTPGAVEGKPGAPAFVHPEGKRWTKTLALQNKAERKTLTKKLSKKK